jgi:hypothetical protein
MEEHFMTQQFFLQICKRWSFVQSSYRVRNNKKVLTGIQSIEDIRNQILIINWFANGNRVVCPIFGSLQIIKAQFGALMKILKLAFQIRNT